MKIVCNEKSLISLKAFLSVGMYAKIYTAMFYFTQTAPGLHFFNIGLYFSCSSLKEQHNGKQRPNIINTHNNVIACHFTQ